MPEISRFFGVIIANPELGTIVWQNGADFDPDVLYAIVTGSPISEYSSAST